MANRIWDPENRYTEGFLKEFKHWIWEVSYRQHTLGSFIIFAKRPVKKLSDLTSEELSSLGKVLKEVEKTYARVKVFKPDWFNYWQMGNSLPHLHIHGFPRYKKPRFFDGKKWIDKTWGHPPIWSKKDVNHELVAKIREEIKKHI
ncbi:MAG: hypothetical protein UX88_C0001G0023 [Candidatus Woesebacteria bacterium GW2011_GWC2_47_16]|uniref:HIT domain-containing protein n=7 Tax=Candidatus Woeseibacteriota TaxID=1752722 RepID=A0A0G1UY49_9BACT|nr:MAG: hypothetical protein UX03_C0003G0028 [Candidatus Woesebacteria bacterium GW2011_GWE1_45_18]KKU25164.1 MAG: hypothetical protein UX34_C0002G0027 [Candidatus Woesebacteria bacterium GW2011_GWF1_46_13]KKU65363.1 MAG: hypothetical protein UX88_C0001G0023 [Candidatus Woesebacteria bacterium GW2011_GWC2_47_16]KKU70973.1 MAG: hypothetical protein UX95_C0008G0014 [Candidatus Woesebacteria bacterium GW2011_GWD1_47_21]OGM84388.1 MAG: hypothetical protein A2376_01770 [Candidatus Woesebacteria bact